MVYVGSPHGRFRPRKDGKNVNIKPEYPKFYITIRNTNNFLRHHKSYWTVHSSYELLFTGTGLLLESFMYLFLQIMHVMLIDSIFPQQKKQKWIKLELSYYCL